MPVLEGPTPYTGGESYQSKFSAPAPAETTEAPQPHPGWTRTWHLAPGLAESGALSPRAQLAAATPVSPALRRLTPALVGQFETTAPPASSVLLARPWDAPALRTEAAAGPLGWRAALEGVTTVTDTPWPFELDKRNGRLKCLACCASAAGECKLETCGMKVCDCLLLCAVAIC